MAPNKPLGREVTRRKFLAALGAGGALVSLGAAACAQQPAAQPTQASKPAATQAPAPAATQAPKPAATQAPAALSGASLRLWILKTYVEPTNKAIEASAAEWAKKNNAQVTVEYFTFEDMQTKMVAGIETKSTPDVAQLETGAPIRFHGMGQLIDVTQLAQDLVATAGEIPSNFKNIVTAGGKVVAIPWYNMHAFWYIWRDMWDKAKLPYPKTFEEAKQTAKELTRESEGFYGMGQSWNRTSDGYGVMQSLMYSYGASWADENGKYKSIKTPEMKAALKWATDIYLEKVVPPDCLSWTGSQNNEAYVARKIGSTSNGPSITYALENAVANAKDAAEKKAAEEKLANSLALPHPAGPAGRRSWAVASSLGIFKSTKNPEAAMSLIKHLSSPEEMNKIMQQSYGQFAPVLTKVREATKDYFNKNDNYKTFGKEAEAFAGTGWPGPTTAAAAEVQASNVLTDMAAKVIVDKWSLDQALDWADKKIKEIYDSIPA